jgi:hypothetical protein
MLPLGQLTAQGEIIVDAAGGGDFIELQPAIDAAEPWQIIRVRHGSYTGATISKSVRLLGDPWQQVSPTEASFIEITSPILIRDLPAESGVVITDLAADPVGKSQDFDDLIDAKNCAGPIHLAFTHQGNIVLEDCTYVTINDHFSRGRIRAVRSTVVSSNCLLREWSGHTIDLFASDFFASFLVTGPFKEGDRAVRVDGGSRFIADFNSAIVGGGFGNPAFTIIDGTVDEKRRDSLAFNGNRGLPPIQATEYLLFELNNPHVTVQAEAFGASLPSLPNTTPQGEFFLDPGTFELLHFGIGFTDADVRVHLPAILKPSRYFDTSFPSRRALPDAQLQGIPVVFQGAFLIDGVAKYTLPYVLVL